MTDDAENTMARQVMESLPAGQRKTFLEAEADAVREFYKDEDQEQPDMSATQEMIREAIRTHDREREQAILGQPVRRRRITEMEED